MNNMKFTNLFYDVKKLISLEWFYAKPDELGVSDLLLPVAFCDDESIILNKDGSFSWSFWYSGAPYDSSSSEELDYLNSEIYSRAFAFLGDGWSMHLRDDRITAKGYIDESECYFSDPTTKIIDLERRFRYDSDGNNEFLNRFIITFTYLPPIDAGEKQKNWFVENMEEGFVIYSEHLKKFKDTVKQVLDQLSYSVWTKPLSKPETKKYLHKCINGFEFNYHETPYDYLDMAYLLSTQDLTKGLNPKIGDYYIGVVCVGEGLPVRATPAYLHALTTLPFEYSWITRFIFFDKETAQKMLDKTVEYHYAARESLKKSFGNKSRNDGTVRFNRAAGTLAEQAEQSLEKLDIEQITYGKYTGSIIVFDKNLETLDEKLDLVRKTLSSANFMAKKEEANCLDAYLGTIPGMVRNNVRKWVMDTINLADIMPTTDTWAGYEKHPSIYYVNNNPPTFYALTREGTIFRGCGFVGDIGHRFIVGPSRAGKSVLVNFWAAQEFRYKGTRLFHFDYGYSGQILNFACNGSHFDIINENGSLAYKPFELVDNPEDFTFLVTWLCEIAEINLGRKVVADEKNAITRVLEIIKQNGTPEQRTMTYFYFQLKAHAKNTDLEQAFIGYIASSAKSSIKNNIFNSLKDNFKINNYCMFEMEKLIKLPEDIFIPVVRYLFHMVYRSLDGRPTVIIIEECQAFAKSPITIEMLDDALRRYAKKACSIVLVTQQVNDLLKSPLWDVIQDQCKTKVFLPNPSLTTNPQTPILYSHFGLNDQQIGMIASAVIQREYFFTNAMGSRLFNLDLEDVALCFLAKNKVEDIKFARQLKAKTNDLFGYYWLKHCKLDDVAELWLAEHNKFKIKVKNIG